jgi:CubicO group peptidase (beta-lactamase class C family)
MLEKNLDPLMELYLKEGFFPGLVCHIVQGDKVLFHKSYGAASTRPVQRNMAPSTNFDIASLTKIVTTTMILRLVTTGKISLYTTLDQCLASVANNPTLPNYFSNTTINMLLTHTSGLPDWYPFYSSHLCFYKCLEQIISSTEPEIGVKYSDLNYMLLGEVIKETTGLSLKRAVDQLVRQPLNLQRMEYGPLQGDNISIAATEFGNRIEQGMCRTRGITFDRWREENRAIRGEVNDGNAFYFFQGEAGHAGLFAHAEDVSSLGQLYVNRGEWNGEILIDPDLIDISITEQAPSRGLGWELSSLFPKGCGHTGFTGTSLWLIPQEKMVVVTLTNRLHQEKPKNINPFRKELHATILNMI